MFEFTEMDPRVTFGEQLNEEDGGPVILINRFTVDPEQADELLEAWRLTSVVMARQPGYISTQMHRGTNGSGVFVNYAVWESAGDLRRAYEAPEFVAASGGYPPSATTSPHLFRKVAVPRICLG